MQGERVPWELQQEIEQFLYYEAWLLDEGRFYEWLDLFTDDARYWMPVRETTESRESMSPPEGVTALPLFDDDKSFLVTRVRRFDTGLAHAEQPPSRTRHLVSNVRIEPDGADAVRVYSSFLVLQTRFEISQSLFSGKREDSLRRVADGWRIAGRKIFLDQTLLPRSISIFF